MNITQETFHSLFPSALNPGAWAAALNKFLPRYGIDTLPRVSAFLAQWGHESGGFVRMVENMNYSADGLAATWPGRYAENPKAIKKKPNQLALSLHRQPEKIANNVYANRMGNGPEESGDGWKHRGHGVPQLTGKEKHLAFAKYVGIDPDAVCGYLLSVEGSIHAACWYWDTHGCNALADAGKFIALTKSINGGVIGLPDRTARYETYYKTLPAVV